MAATRWAAACIVPELSQPGVQVYAARFAVALLRLPKVFRTFECDGLAGWLAGSRLGWRSIDR